MYCSVSECKLSDNKFLWKCSGSCGRQYHTACIGVQRNFESKACDYLVPLCTNCRVHVADCVNLKMITQQQEALTTAMDDQFKAHTKMFDDLRKVSSLGNKIETLLDSFDSIDTMLSDIKNEIIGLHKKSRDDVCCPSNYASSESKRSIDNLKIDLLEVNSNMQKKIETALKNGLAHVSSKIAMSSLPVESHCTNCPTSEFTDDVKALCTAVSSLINNNNINSNVNHSRSIAEEIADVNCSSPPSTTESEPVNGWRWLGSKRIWKNDWRDYDEKKRRQNLQNNAAQKARRKKQIKKRRNCNNTNNNTKRLNIDNYRNDINHGSANNNNNIIIDNNNNINNRLFSSSNSNVFFGQKNAFSHKTQGSNYCSTGNLLRSLYSGSQLQHITQLPLPTQHNDKRNTTSYCTTDKELLAAAKVTFSGPNQSNHKPILFERGEILNPYHNAPTNFSMTTPITTVAKTPVSVLQTSAPTPLMSPTGSLNNRRAPEAVHSSACCAGCALMATWVPSHPEFSSRDPSF